MINKMGMYNTYWSKDDKESVQLKVGDELLCDNYRPGDEVDIDDGIYVGLNGIVVIYNKKLVDVYQHIIDKWGNKLEVNYEFFNSEAFRILFGYKNGK